MTKKDKEALRIADELIFKLHSFISNIIGGDVDDELCTLDDIKRQTMCERYLKLRGIKKIKQ